MCECMHFKDTVCTEEAWIHSVEVVSHHTIQNNKHTHTGLRANSSIIQQVAVSHLKDLFMYTVCGCVCVITFNSQSLVHPVIQSFSALLAACKFSLITLTRRETAKNRSLLWKHSSCGSFEGRLTHRVWGYKWYMLTRILTWRHKHMCSIPWGIKH